MRESITDNPLHNSFASRVTAVKNKNYSAVNQSDAIFSRTGSVQVPIGASTAFEIRPTPPCFLRCRIMAQWVVSWTLPVNFKEISALLYYFAFTSYKPRCARSGVDLTLILLLAVVGRPRLSAFTSSGNSFLMKGLLAKKVVLQTPQYRKLDLPLTVWHHGNTLFFCRILSPRLLHKMTTNADQWKWRKIRIPLTNGSDVK